jgi:hypothetical protein
MGLFAERLRPAVDGGSLEHGIADAAPFTGVLGVRLEPNELAHRLKPYREKPRERGSTKISLCPATPPSNGGSKTLREKPRERGSGTFSRHQDHAGPGVSLKNPPPFDTLPVSAPPRALLGRNPRQTQGEMSVPGR